MSEYQAFRLSLIETFQPQGTMENLLVEKIACLAWQQRRAIQAESSLFHKGLSSEWNRKVLKAFFKVEMVIVSKTFQGTKQISKRTSIELCIS